MNTRTDLQLPLYFVFLSGKNIGLEILRGTTRWQKNKFVKTTQGQKKVRVENNQIGPRENAKDKEEEKKESGESIGQNDAETQKKEVWKGKRPESCPV